MRFIADLFFKDAQEEPTETRTVLLGSPGVGKSILCFLAALIRSQRDIIIFYRKVTDTGERLSVFVMFPCQGNTVNVLYTRGSKDENKKLSLQDVDEFLKNLLEISRAHYFAFVNGPHWKDNLNTLEKDYDYLCTSGGHPPFKPSDEEGSRMWVLDAWTEEESMDALTALGRPHDKAKDAYWLCGGSIRDMLSAVKDSGTRKERIDQNLSFFRDNDLLAERSTIVIDRSEGVRDRLRRMFRDPAGTSTKVMRIVQLVDSEYAAKVLRNTITLEKFFGAYNLAVTIKDRTAQGVFFECVIHRWFDGATRSPIEKICWSSGSGDDGVAEFVESNVYWIPSISNFPAIDSAVVIGDTLHALQITIRDDHPFCMATFKRKFVSPSRNGSPISSG
jgi:hypothetical protein